MMTSMGRPERRNLAHTTERRIHEMCREDIAYRHAVTSNDLYTMQRVLEIYGEKSDFKAVEEQIRLGKQWEL